MIARVVCIGDKIHHQPQTTRPIYIEEEVVDEKRERGKETSRQQVETCVEFNGKQLKTDRSSQSEGKSRQNRQPTAADTCPVAFMLGKDLSVYFWDTEKRREAGSRKLSQVPVGVTACDSCDSDNLPPSAAGEGEYPRNQEDYSTTEETTDEPEAESSTWNRFNEAGWQTDKSGNVFIGDDNAKLYLISVGSYWPFPKDYK